MRPETGLSRRAGETDTDLRPRLWAHAASRLAAAGYEARSMRSFVRRGATEIATRYRCEADAMIGLGPGARSYTAAVHWAEPWSVAASRVRATIAAWSTEDDAGFATARHGIELDDDERHRRFVIQTLLEVTGVDLAEREARFGPPLPELRELEREGLAVDRGGRLRLTPEGLAASDLIGPYLYSSAVRERMATRVPT